MSKGPYLTLTECLINDECTVSCKYDCNIHILEELYC